MNPGNPSPIKRFPIRDKRDASAVAPRGARPPLHLRNAVHARSYQRTSPSESNVPDRDRIVAISLLTSEDIQVLGSSLKRVYPVPEDGSFDDLLRALDREDSRRPRQR